MHNLQANKLARIARAIATLALATAALIATATASEAPQMSTSGAFDVSAAGAASYSIPIRVPPGTAGMVPEVSLNYSSQGSNGIVGYGFTLGIGIAPADPAHAKGQKLSDAPTGSATIGASGSQSISEPSAGSIAGKGATTSGLPTITRCAKTIAQDGVHGGVHYDAGSGTDATNDRFCLNGDRLIKISSGGYGVDLSEYRTEIDNFTKVIAHGTAGNGPAWFEVHQRNGIALEFGKTPDSQIVAVGSSTARAWALDQATDSKGNFFTVTYTDDSINGQFYPTRIDYTGNGTTLTPYNSVRFTYNTTRADVMPVYQAGSLQKTTVLLTDIKTYQGSNVVLDYKLAYRPGTNLLHSRLTSVTECNSTGTTCLAPTTFTWQGGNGIGTQTIISIPLHFGPPPFGGANPGFGDFNGDGLTDYAGATPDTACPSGGEVELGTLSPGVFTPSTMTVTQSGTTTHACIITAGLVGTATPDFDGFEASGFSFSSGAQLQRVYANDNHLNFNALTLPLATQIGLGGDLNGDGRRDLLSWTSPNFLPYLSTGAGSFTAGTSFPSSSGGKTYSYVTSADFGGSGCADIMLMYTGSGGTFGTTVRYSCGGSVIDFPNVFLGFPPGGPVAFPIGDFNGDGMTDPIDTIDWTNWYLHLATGNNFAVGTTSIPSVGDCVAGDFDGDGRDELACEDGHIYSWTGSAFVSVTTWGTAFSWTPVVADVNSDGVADFGLPSTTGTLDFRTFAYAPETITDISNGIGSTTHITYDRLNKNGTFYTKGTSGTYPKQDYDGAMYVVSQITASNAIGGNNITTYSYAGLTRDLNGRGLLGFATVIENDQRTGFIKTTNYRSDFPYIGYMSSQTVVTSSTSVGCTAGVTIKSVTNTPNSVNLGGTRNFVFTDQSVAASKDCDGSVLPTVTTSYDYDCEHPGTCYGQLLSENTAVSDGSSRTVTNSNFVNDATHWCFDEPQTTAEQRIVGASNLTRTTNHTYDTCLVTKEIVEPSDAAHLLETDTPRDGFGNVTDVTQSGGSGLSAILSRTTHYDYDALGEFVIDSVVQPSSTAPTQTTTYTHDARFGGITQVKDPNLLAANTTYDTFGRLSSVKPPDLTKVVTAYDYCAGVNGGTHSGCPSNGAVVVTATPLGTDAATQVSAITITYYDALYRIIATDVQGFAGAWIRAETQYDSKLCVGQTSRPYFLLPVPDPRWTVNGNDALCRPTTITRPDGGQTTTDYSGLTATVVVKQTSTISETTVTTKNAQDLIQQVKDPALKNVTYTYDAFNNLATITDHSGNVTTNLYDIRGNRTDLTDPDLGHWHYDYDVLGELVQQTDPVEAANGQTTALSYDLLGRLIHRVEPDVPTGLITSNWVYDTSATKGIGKLDYACIGSSCTSSSFTYLRKQSYDSKGRPSIATLNITGTNYTYQVTYDSLSGKVATLKYPSGFTIANAYQPLYGYLSTVSDSATSALLWTITGRNAELEASGQTLGSGDTETQVFDPNTGRVQQIRAGVSDGLANFSYSFDLIGNLTDRSDTLNTYSEHFCYDTLNRLTTYGVNLGAGCPQTGGKTITYNLLGNIKSKSDIATNYAYPNSGAGSVLPHAVSSITGTVGGIVNPHYSYDANGNLMCVYTSGHSCTSSPSKTVNWTRANMIASMVQGTTTVSLSYDEARQRITQTEPSGTTNYYLDPMAGAFSEQAGADWHDYINVDGKFVAEHMQPSSGSAYVNYFINDHLGSVAVVKITKPGSSGIERDSYDAWGMRRNANGTDAPACNLISSTKRGFTNQEMIDALCLVNLNARVYDPVIGRFLSADDVIDDPYNLQHLNRYSYVNNGPLSFIDPTGHVPGDPFDTPDQAGYDAVKSTNKQSISQNTEMGGGIYRGQDGKFRAQPPVKGTGDSIPWSYTGEKGTLVGDYHDHGDYSKVGHDGNPVRIDPNASNRASKDQYKSDHFSTPDKQNSRRIEKHEDNPNYRSYLGTPSGDIKKYDPVTHQETTMSDPSAAAAPASAAPAAAAQPTVAAPPPQPKPESSEEPAPVSHLR